MWNDDQRFRPGIDHVADESSKPPLAEWLDVLNKLGAKYPTDGEMRAFLDGVSFGRAAERHGESR